jgi:Domain of unknown function (DUF4345)
VLTLLKVLGTTIVAIGLLKVVMGAKADRLLDESIPLAAVMHPSIDSQIRFYGGAFSVYGVLLWLCANDITKYADVFKVLMIVFFLAGLARIPAFFLRGRPSLVIAALWALEVIVPPLLLWWQATL